ncbi:hypothetical protein [Georgenia muralis]|uniref:Response regulatory domain-containing protein n=1 Tax=Georgenia muralis TaxID=154117 RepID=A0A3N4ZJI2_9MICO|nr:hypothetical protein [Georgenia muralis]RPF25998.1 hypothetical protein EDD32_0415 [Georgenia muralis]
MTLAEFEKVVIVDDDPNVRRAYALTVEDASLQAVQVDGPIDSLQGFVAGLEMKRAGAVCDFELGARNFAHFTGAELVSEWYKSGVPAVLCTRFEKAQLDRIRPYREWIPCLLTPSELNPDSLMESLKVVAREIAGHYRQSRTAYRTLIRVVEIDPGDAGAFLFEMPGWSTDIILRFRLADLPRDLRGQIAPGFCTHVRANLGAEKFEDLYFTDWGCA